MPEQRSEVAVTKVLTSVRGRAGVDAAFAARVEPGARAMRILYVRGGLTKSLSGLTIASGAGLGGKSLVLGRPVRVDNYLAARGITHNYDHAVEKEQLRTVAAMPVRGDGAPRYVIYVGTRGDKALGDRWLDAMAPVVRELEQEIAVADEVERRLSALAADVHARRDPAVLTAGEMQEIAGELAELAGAVHDASLRQRLEALHDRLAPGHAQQPWRERPDLGLTPREVAVLEKVALGGTNAVVAEGLGLLPNTVKSYLKSAMRKLGASNRVQAIVEARNLGILP
ncbi:hypothetical protein BWI15_00215 [Kribbella sp. ALI-6-A]|nr:hypothetical protein BWI15_00215 [Kribbella sp. ALI-6-A]